jgi:hypothetical protein
LARLITLDSAPPEISNIFPVASSVDAFHATNISFTITDVGTGIDLSSLDVSIASISAISNGSFESGFSGTISPVLNGYDVVIVPSADLGYDQVIAIDVYVQDLAPTFNYISGAWDFSTASLVPYMMRAYRSISGEYVYWPSALPDPSAEDAPYPAVELSDIVITSIVEEGEQAYNMRAYYAGEYRYVYWLSYGQPDTLGELAPVSALYLTDIIVSSAFKDSTYTPPFSESFEFSGSWPGTFDYGYWLTYTGFASPSADFSESFEFSGSWPGTFDYGYWLTYTGFASPSADFSESFETAGGWPGTGDFDKVSLLLQMQGVDGASSFPDSSMYSNTVTPVGDLGNLPTTSSVANSPNPIGQPASYYNNGFGYQALEVPSSALFDFLDGDFTIETWLLVGAVAGYDCPIYLGNPTITGGLSFVYIINQATSVAELQYSVDGVSFITANSSAWALSSAWHFLAVSRNGPDLRLFWDGVQVGATYNIGTASLFPSSTVPGTKLYVGSAGPNFYSASMGGSILDLRITKGIGRYPANFAVPTQPFPKS